MAAKGLVFASLALLLACGVAIQTPNTTHAWSGNLSTCDLGSFDWRAALQDRLGHAPDNSDRFILARTDLSGGRIVIYYAASSGQGVGMLDSPNSAYLFSGAHRVFYDTSTYALLADQTFSDNTFADPTCISYANNLSMNSTGYTYPTYDFTSGDPSPSPTPTPSESPSPTPTPSVSPAPTGMTPDESKKFAQKMGIILSFIVSGWFIYQFRFGRHE